MASKGAGAYVEGLRATSCQAGLVISILFVFFYGILTTGQRPTRQRYWCRNHRLNTNSMFPETWKNIRFTCTGSSKTKVSLTQARKKSWFCGRQLDPNNGCWPWLHRRTMIRMRLESDGCKTQWENWGCGDTFKTLGKQLQLPATSSKLDARDWGFAAKLAKTRGKHRLLAMFENRKENIGT